MTKGSRLLIIAVIAQMAVLVGMYVTAALPLWTGAEIRLATAPVDPRSLFRGDYALLSYDISEIDSTYFKNLDELRHGEIVFILLSNTDEVSRLDGVTLMKPSEGRFVRGRLQNPNSSLATQRIRYGIEAFFAPKEEALLLEKKLRTGAVAVVFLSQNGKPALHAIEPRR